jgi:hypothetical protein
MPALPASATQRWLLTVNAREVIMARRSRAGLRAAFPDMSVAVG